MAIHSQRTMRRDAKMDYETFAKLIQLCQECEVRGCTYNHDGECRFVFVHERKPNINDIDGCTDYQERGM